MEFSALIMEALSTFQLSEFKSNAQKEAIEIILKGEYKNYIVNMASQGGKSLCYQLPGYMKKGGLTIYFSPSLALLSDQEKYLNSRNILSRRIDGTVDLQTRDEIRALIEDFDPELRFLFVTSEVIEKNFCMNTFMDTLIDCKRVINYIVIDEAHKIFQNFRSSLTKTPKYRLKNLETTWIALTTINKHLEAELAQKYNMKNYLSLSSSSERDEIFYQVFEDDEGNRNVADFVKKLSNEGEEKPSGIIFCKLIDHVEETHKYLKNQRISAETYYGGKSDNNLSVIEQWREKKFQVLVATGESFGFGIINYVPKIRFVIHLNMPQEFLSFYHVSKFFYRLYENADF
jgi:ATP-dependent DNA helicase RecQ